MDPLILVSILDAYPLSKAEVANYPLLGKAAKDTGTLFVKRDEKSSRKAILLEMETHFKRGKSIMIFPEGTTSSNLTCLPFRQGGIALARSTGIPVVPVALIFPSDAYFWDDGGLMGHFRSFVSHPKSHVIVKFGQPIRFQPDDQDLVKVEHTVRQMLLSKY